MDYTGQHIIIAAGIAFSVGLVIGFIWGAT